MSPYHADTVIRRANVITIDPTSPGPPQLPQATAATGRGLRG